MLHSAPLPMTRRPDPLESRRDHTRVDSAQTYQTGRSALVKLRLTINGVTRQVVTDPHASLLDLLRDTYRLTGAKQSCDRRASAAPARSSSTARPCARARPRSARLDGADIITVEGLGTPANPHLIQEAFVLAGRRAVRLLHPRHDHGRQGAARREPRSRPREEIKHALRHNLCRCTGYVKIVDAVKLAGRSCAARSTPDALRPDPDGPKIGVSHPRPSAMIKACGVAEFTRRHPRCPARSSWRPCTARTPTP